MSIAVLGEVYNETRRLAIAGSGLASGDFRLKRLIGPLEKAGEQAPVFGKVAEAIKNVVIIATANTRDRGVNDMSAALKRRFNIVVLPSPKELDTEVDIVTRRVRELASNLDRRCLSCFGAGQRPAAHDR